MGRPPKKRSRVEDDVPELSNSNVWPSPEGTPPDPSFALPDFGISHAALEARELCPLIFWRNPNESGLPMDVEHQSLAWGMPPERLKDPYPASQGDWPDFSTVLQSAADPISSPLNFANITSLPLTPPTDNTAGRQCTCLSYPYLCLSHISSISAFPVNSHTICSLQIGARTAHNVISCEICPKSFATGVQNVMFTGALLTVLADAWLRLAQSNPIELGIQHAPPDYIEKISHSEDPAQGWREWLQQTVRKGVIGGNLDPDAVRPCSGQPSLLELILAVEDRQRRWHEPGNHPLHDNHFLGPGDQKKDCQPLDERSLLCMRVVGSARAVLAKFNFKPEDFPGGVVPEGLDITAP
ncbi:hypothetical protein N7470_007420 [Penicillium chermesinum]|nr:hypothetical protein N7470_007420 [Penicillium chermesinum]